MPPISLFYTAKKAFCLLSCPGQHLYFICLCYTHEPKTEQDYKKEGYFFLSRPTLRNCFVYYNKECCRLSSNLVFRPSRWINWEVSWVLHTYQNGLKNTLNPWHSGILPEFHHAKHPSYFPCSGNIMTLLMDLQLTCSNDKRCRALSTEDVKAAFCRIKRCQFSIRKKQLKLDNGYEQPDRSEPEGFASLRTPLLLTAGQPYANKALTEMLLRK